MAKWVRFNSNGQTCLGMLDGDNISLCSNDLYAEPAPTGENVALSDVELLTPFTPNSILALWNNFYERAEAEGQTIPTNPLYFMKPVTSVIGPNQMISRPHDYQGGVKFEAELGVVIGRRCSNVGPDEVDDVIFGYTCVNDVTAAEFMISRVDVSEQGHAPAAGLVRRHRINGHGGIATRQPLGRRAGFGQRDDGLDRTCRTQGARDREW